MTIGMGAAILERIERAVLKVRERLVRATSALRQAGIPYAVVGGNAIASWVATVDEGAVRTTRDVDLLVDRADLPALTTALEQVGFVADDIMGVIMFRDGPDGKPSEAIHLLFAGEKTRPDHLLPAPAIQTIPAQVAAALNHLEANVAEPITPARLAQHAGMKPHRFARFLKKFFGLTPSQFITKARITAATRALCDTTHSVAEIALACGFYDHSAFTCVFRKVTGLTPTEPRARQHATAPA